MSLPKKSKIILLFLLISLTVISGVYNYIMKPPKNIASMKINFTGTSNEFIKLVEESSIEWLGKIVILEGLVTSKDAKGIMINNRIYCQFIDPTEIKVFQQKIKIKGRFIGYDDLMSELKLDQCDFQN